VTWKIGSLFSGLGMLELGLERAGLGEVVWQVERESFCRKVLARHWPEATRYEDVQHLRDGDLELVDVVCGGFPCQPISVAGSRKGHEDARWLWPDFAYVVETLTPKAVLIENVPGLRSSGLRDVLFDLATLGFDAEWTCLSAADFGAPHIRRRMFIVATHAKRLPVRLEPGWLSRALESARQAVPGHDVEAFALAHAGARPDRGRTGDAARSPAEVAAPDPYGEGRLQSAIEFAESRGWSGYCGWRFDPAQGVDDGPAGRVERTRRRKALGNGVVVRCAEEVGRALKAAVHA
jgi:DNA (cytosine-5)-methyltransferase 1